MNTISPDESQLQTFVGGERTQPLVMVNLLKFRPRASYPETYRVAHGDADCSGEDAYMRYGAVATRKVAGVGGRVLWAGPAQQTFIGPADVDWDMVALVFYPSRASFLEMLADPEYQAAHVHREAGVEHMHLIQCDGAAVAA
jgi:uncharacterized protein (DUF1330 family)